MLNQISLAKNHSKTQDAVDLLIGCHQRIRHFTGVAMKLAHAQGASPEEVTQAAAGAHRYYTVSLPLHEADEEDTLRPRLDALGDDELGPCPLGRLRLIRRADLVDDQNAGFAQPLEVCKRELRGAIVPGGIQREFARKAFGGLDGVGRLDCGGDNGSSQAGLR